MNYLVETIMGTLQGDLNLDGVLNFNDYLNILQTWHMSGTNWLEGNQNLDDIADHRDYFLLTNRYDLDLTTESSGTGVPEAGSLAMIAAMGLLALSGRRLCGR